MNLLKSLDVALGEFESTLDMLLEKAKKPKKEFKGFLLDAPKVKASSGTLKTKGEGSRGGRVIGRTKSGKPIYDKHNHPAHKGFSAKDHVDAYWKQTDLGNSKKLPMKECNLHHKEADKHWGSVEKKDPRLAEKLMSES